MSVQKSSFSLLLFALILNYGIISAQEKGMTIGTNFWDQAWGGADPWKSGIRQTHAADQIMTCLPLLYFVFFILYFVLLLPPGVYK